MSEHERCPRSQAEWWKAAEKLTKHASSRNVKSKIDIGLSSMPSESRHSASKMKHEQYILLRAYATEHDQSEFNLEEFVGSELRREARETIKMSEEFGEYQQLLARKVQSSKQVSKSAFVRAGALGLVLYQQNQISRIHVGQFIVDGATKLVMSPRYKTRSYVQREPEDSPTNFVAAVIRRDAGRNDDSALIANMSSLNIGTPRTASPERDTEFASADTQDRNSDFESSNGASLSQFSPRQVKAANDEQIVNCALVSFLQAITMSFTSIAEWATDRNIFNMNGLYEARTDGCLFLGALSVPLAILEAKAYVRKRAQAQITIQESAQMAAWIRTYPSLGVLPHFSSSDPKFKRRLLISQDNREIYLTIAHYTKDYEDYLKYTSVIPDENQTSGTVSEMDTPYSFDSGVDGPFLEMRRYGPFDMLNPDHMRRVATAVIAMTKALERAYNKPLTELADRGGKELF